MVASLTFTDDDTLLEVLRRHAEDAPETPSILFYQNSRTRTLSRSELLTGASRFARFLSAQGVGRGEVVLIILRQSPEMLQAFLGVMMLGAIPSFMPVLTNKQDPARYWGSHSQLFRRIGTGTLLLSAENLNLVRTCLPDLPLRIVMAEDVPEQETGFEWVKASPDEIALLQHSSGTTGLKKGVALSHRAILRQISSYARSLSLVTGDRIVSWLPLYHDMGLIACFLLPILTGTTVIMMDPFEWVTNPGILFAKIKEHQATLSWMPNFAFQHLCRTVRPSADIELGSMRAWINCSEPCRPETFDAFLRSFSRNGVKAEHLQVCYAMAETVFAVTQTPPLLQVNRRSPPPGAGVELPCLAAGRPIEGIEVRIMDEQGVELPARMVGEICIRGDFLFSGYHRFEEETRKRMHAGWYHTGDLGFLQEGELHVTGRKNDLIIVHGRNYYAHELEFIVNQVPGTHAGRNVAVGWFKPEVGSEEVVIIAEHPNPNAAAALQPPLGQAIKQALLDSAGLLVHDVHLVPPGWLAKTTSGKISRKDNLTRYLAEMGIHSSNT